MKNKRVLITSILLPLILVLFCQNGLQAQNGNQEIGKFALAIHPLGALQFGITLEGDFGITDNATVGLNFRYTSLGLAIKQR